MEFSSALVLFIGLHECVVPTIETSRNLPTFDQIHQALSVADSDIATVNRAMTALTSEQQVWNRWLLSEAVDIHNEWLAVGYAIDYMHVVKMRWQLDKSYVVVYQSPESFEYGSCPLPSFLNSYFDRNRILRIPISQRKK